MERRVLINMNHHGIRKMFYLLIVAMICYGCSGLHKNIHSSASQSFEKGKGKSNFISLEVGDSMENALVEDFNNDGNFDIVAVSHGASCMKVFLGSGDRKFELRQVLSKDIIGFHPNNIVAVDWNSDGFKDVLLAAEGLSSVLLLENDEGRGFHKVAVFPVKYPPQNIAVFDLDNDGNLDIVLTPYSPKNMMILWGNSKNNFKFNVSEIKVKKFVSSVWLDDWNMDGHTDIFFGEAYAKRITVALNQGGRRFVLRAIFQWVRKNGYDIPKMPGNVVTADINSDGCPDALSAMEIGKTAIIAYGNCKGGTSTIEYIKAPAWGYWSIGAVSGNDLHSSLIALGENQRIFIAARGKNKRWEMKEYKAGKVPCNFIFKDIDKDGHLDLLFVNEAQDDLGIYFGPLI